MRLALFLLLLLLPCTSFGGTLFTLIELAVKNNPEVKRALEEEKISELQYKEAVADFLPKVSLQYVKTSLSDVPAYSMALSGFPPARFNILEDNFYELKVNLTQPLFTGGRLLFGVKMKKEFKTASFFRFKETVLKVVTEVKKDYYTLLEANSALKIAEKTLSAIKEHYRTVKAFYDEGIVPRRDLLEATFKLKEAEENLEKAKSFYRKALEKLKKDTGYAVKEVPLDEGELSYVPVKLSEKELLTLAFRNRPIIKAVEAVERGTNYGVKVAYSRFLPELLLQASYDRTDRYPGIGNFDSTSVSLVFNFPIFEGGKRFLAVKEAKAKKRQAELSIKKIKDSVRLQVVSAFSTLKATEARIASAKAMVESARELLRVSKERYRERVGTSTEVVDAIAYLAKAEGLLNSALADYNRALADLEYAVGTTLRPE